MWNLLLVILCLHSVEVFSVAVDFDEPQKVFYELNDVDGHFKDFLTKYNKNYDSAELAHRRKVFAENLMKYNEWNRQHTNTVFGITPFSDMTFEEFRQTHACVRGNSTNHSVTKFVAKGTSPDSLDWRQQNIVTRVKDQGRCGSCYIFSAIGNIEGQHAKQHGQLVDISEQQTLDCHSNGCEGGWPDQVMQQLSSVGCMKQSDYPYTGVAGQCRENPSQVVVKVTGGSKLSIASEDQLKEAVATYGPLSIVLNVDQTFMAYRGGVYTPSGPCGRDLHALLLVGYGTDGGQPYWLIKNSWASTWGEQGYIRLARGQRACNIGQYAASSTVA